MNQDTFDFFSGFAKEQSGLALSSDKAYLLETRLMPIARCRGMTSLDEIAQVLRKKQDQELARQVTEALTTNESSFFRDGKPFQYFRERLLPQLLERRAAQKKIRIWSAAASSGQEAYSLAMILEEERMKLSGWTFEIIGTDISQAMLEKARGGIYTQFEVQRGLPIQLLTKYFEKSGDHWKVAEKLRSMVTFKQHNLLHSGRSLGKFDVVFCRNVLIYFDLETKRSVLNDMRELVAEDGALLLGGAETVVGVSDAFRPIENERGAYRPVLAQPAASAVAMN